MYSITMAAANVPSVLATARDSCLNATSKLLSAREVIRGRTQGILKADQVKRDDHLNSVVRAVARTYSLLLRGLDRVSELRSHQQVSELIFSLVEMIRELLKCLHETARTQVNDSAPQDAIDSGATKKTPRSQDVPKIFAQLIMAMLDKLDAKKQAHREMFEGFAFVILERVGKELYTLAFGKERAASLEQEIGRPGDVLVHSTERDSEDSSRLGRVGAEAPYLLSIFQRAVSLAPAHLTNLDTTARVTRNSNKSSLPTIAKERLQQTLVQGMFGPDDAWRDVLKTPARPRVGTLPPKEGKVDVGMWFTEEVWRVLGWEILGREGDLDAF